MALQTQERTLAARSRALGEMARHYEGYAKGVKTAMAAARQGTLRGVIGPGGSSSTWPPLTPWPWRPPWGAPCRTSWWRMRRPVRPSSAWSSRGTAAASPACPSPPSAPPSCGRRGWNRSPAYLAVAADLVDCDPRLRPAAQALLGRTVVVDHLDHGVALARAGRYRFPVVTLEGEILRPGGSMTGGSVQRTGGLLTRGAEEADLAGRLAKAQQALAQGGGQLRAARQQVRQASEALEAKQAAGPPQDTTLIQQAQEETLRARREELAALQGTLGGLRSPAGPAPASAGQRSGRPGPARPPSFSAGRRRTRASPRRSPPWSGKLPPWNRPARPWPPRGRPASRPSGPWTRPGRRMTGPPSQANDTQLRLQRSAGPWSRKKLQANLEEKRLLDRLWDTYGLTHQAALALRQPVEDPAQAKRKTAQLNRAIQALGTVNLGALEEYQRVEERYRYLTDQKTDVETARQELEGGVIDGITREMETIFRREFAKVQAAFAQTFADLFGGGRGTLALEDENDVLRCGIDIQVQPPGKTLRSISLLSGGERSLVAIALYFAILKVHPTPFCVMDEIEAALDEANGARFIRYLGKVAGQTQFLLITHRRETMEAADVLYGVTMERQGSAGC